MSITWIGQEMNNIYSCRVGAVPTTRVCITTIESESRDVTHRKKVMKEFSLPTAGESQDKGVTDKSLLSD